MATDNDKMSMRDSDYEGSQREKSRAKPDLRRFEQRGL